MKDLVCPTCNTRNVPFWRVFWGFGPFTKIRCVACGTRVKHHFWASLSLDLVLLLIAMTIGAALLAVTVEIPFLGIPLLAIFFFGLNWLQVVMLKLKSVEEEKEKEEEHTP